MLLRPPILLFRFCHLCSELRAFEPSFFSVNNCWGGSDGNMEEPEKANIEERRADEEESESFDNSTSIKYNRIRLAVYIK